MFLYGVVKNCVQHKLLDMAESHTQMIFERIESKLNVI